MEKELSMIKRAEEFLQIFKKGEEFTKELLRENERLRFRIVQLEEALRRTEEEGSIKKYEERIRTIEDALSSLRERYREVEEENRDFATKYLEVEEENNALANLYVASYQLHSTLDFDEVLQIVLEIVINLVGAEQFVIFLIGERTNDIVPAASEGMPLETVPRMRIGEGIIGNVVKDGEGYFSPEIGKGDVTDGIPLACIPLKIKQHVLGAIAIFSLLVQKKGFTHIDHELFNLLAGHAATAIFAAKLYTQAERKLSTIQSFLELLKEKPKIRK